jgi:hypothetical protein
MLNDAERLPQADERGWRRFRCTNNAAYVFKEDTWESYAEIANGINRRDMSQIIDDTISKLKGDRQNPVGRAEIAPGKFVQGFGDYAIFYKSDEAEYFASYLEGALRLATMSCPKFKDGRYPVGVAERFVVHGHGFCKTKDSLDALLKSRLSQMAIANPSLKECELKINALSPTNVECSFVTWKWLESEKVHEALHELFYGERGVFK